VETALLDPRKSRYGRVMAGVEKRVRDGSTRWLARWRDDDGRQRSKSFAKKSEAETYLASITVSLASGDYVDPRAGRVTFIAYYDEYASRQVWRPGTCKAMNLAARSVPFGQHPMGRISRSQVQTWVKQMSGELQPGTVRTRFFNVRQIFRSAVDDRLIRFDPTRGVTLPKVPRADTRMKILTADESRSLFAASKPEFRAFLGVGLFAGLRMGEAAGLQIGDIDFLRRRITVHRQVQRVTGGVAVVPPKSASSARTVPVPDDLIMLLSAHIAQLPDAQPTRFLFETSGGRPTDQNVAGVRPSAAPADAPDWRG
jgi:integrase